MWTSGLGVVISMASALALYAASTHCLWPILKRYRRTARLAGMLLAVVALALWTWALGPAVGLCAMLASWMLTLMALPYIALWTRTGRDGGR